MPGSQLAGLKIYHVIAFLSLNFTSEQNGLLEDGYFSFYITHKGLLDHKATCM